MSSPGRTVPAEWDARVYHRISTPQATWGRDVIDRLPLEGDETVLDAGCGTGILTAQLLERVPRGIAIAVDRSASMLAEASAYLAPKFGNRVSFIQSDLTALQLETPVDAIFSTATFHWIKDHSALFRTMFDCLRPGGWLAAQCGGGPNISRLRDRAERIFAAAHYRGQGVHWPDPWEFATPETTSIRLQGAGFVDVQTWIEAKPTSLSSAAAFREFIDHVVFLEHLTVLPDDRARSDMLDELVRLAGNDDPPFTLDYWRLNMSARRPQTS